MRRTPAPPATSAAPRPGRRRALPRALAAGIAVAVLGGLFLLREEPGPQRSRPASSSPGDDPRAGPGVGPAFTGEAFAGAVGSDAPAAPVALHPIGGVVLAADGSPAPGAAVHVAPAGEEGVTREWVATDAEAHFAASLPPGTWMLHAVHEGLASPRVSVVVGGSRPPPSQIRLVLAPGAFVAGTVRGARDGSTLDACLAEATGAVQVGCNRSGRFRLGPLAPGPAAIRVWAPGHVPREVTLEVAHAGDTRVEIYLTAGARLTGMVADPDRRPFRGVRVRTVHYTLGGDPVREVETVTNADGRYELDGVAPGRVSVRASVRGFAEASTPEFLVDAGEHRELQRLELQPGGAIAGSVRTAAGAPVPGAVVEATRVGDRAPSASDTADSAGLFRLDGLSAGEFSVAAAAPAGQAAPVRVSLAERDEAQAHLVLGAAWVAGRVLDAQGTGIEGALVMAWPMSGAGSAAVSGASGAEGRFRLDGLPSEPLRVEARLQERGWAEKRGVAPGSQVELVLPEGGRIEGVVLDDRGSRLHDFTVTVIPAELPAGEGAAPRYRVLRLLSPDGTFRAEGLPPGSYEVRAAAAGLTSVATQAEVRGGRKTEVELRLLPGASVSGTVFVGDGRHPVAGCRVREEPLFAAFDPPDRPRASAVSDSGGAFLLEGIEAGRRQVEASCPDGGSGRTRMFLAAGERRQVGIRITAEDDGPSEFGGIGAVLAPRAGKVIVASLAEGGPAFLAGVAPGDELVTVDGWPTEGAPLGEVIGRIRGPPGKPVTLELRRGSSESAFRAVVERVRIPTR